ncbi:FAD-dependent monooxygenase [Ottowia thiooxydans]|uniref:FAD-dependent monooxygenase n=1 Tax=Ottowia thiooxydans TaxID=219182 RepID=UPI000408696E|nr:FAD-dependent monooxygenase [Ottowia thiooxydans]
MELTFEEYFPYTHHAARVPELTDGCDTQRHSVVIAGGGPTGLALALGLANHGVASVVLESDDTVCSGSRAGAFTRRTLEILEQLGVIDEVMRTGHAWSTGWTYFRDREVFRLQMPHDDSQKHPPAISHLQNYIEQCLVDAAKRRSDLIDLRWQSRVDKVKQLGDCVRLEVQTPQGNYALETDWLVACDGGRSTVRDMMDLRLQGHRHEGRYVIIDIRIDTEGLPVGRRCWFDPPSKPGGTLLMYKKPGGMLRFDYQLQDDDDEVEEMKPERVFAQVNRHLEMMGIHKEWKPVWMSLYRASAMTLERYWHNRVLFAGDAAHLVPIFGVRGMNSAIDDAHNLAWKLAFVVRGLAAPPLLETYSSERVYAARENHRFASKSAEFMAPPAPAARLMRNAVLSLCEKDPWFSSLLNPRQHSAIPLVKSPLNIPAEATDVFTRGPRPGDILLECPLELQGKPGHLTDLLKPQFTVLYFSEDESLPTDWADAVAELSSRVPLQAHAITRTKSGSASAVDAPGRLFTMYDAVPGTVYLVRPDGHVMGRWKCPAPSVIGQALERVLQAEMETM